MLLGPLASIALALRCQRVANGEQDGWLLPGRKPGTHITAEHLRRRLAVHGITSRPGRPGALLALAGGSPHRPSPNHSASTKPAQRNGRAPPAPPTAATSSCARDVGDVP